MTLDCVSEFGFTKNRDFSEFCDRVILQEYWSSKVFNPGGDPDISLAQTSDEMFAIGRLRHEMYVERDKANLLYADPVSRTLIEPADRLSLNYIVGNGDRCLAGMRLTRAVDCYQDSHLQTIFDHVGLSSQSLARTIYASRFVLRDEMAAKLRITQLFRNVYRTCVLSGAERMLVATHTHLVPLFERFGFRVFSEAVYEPAIPGYITPLVVELHDRDYFVSSRSPCLKAFDEMHDISEMEPQEQFA